MDRRLALAALVAALAIWTIGCGGQPEFVKSAKPAKPLDIGSPSQFPVGVTPYGNGQYFVVVTEDGGEKHLSVYLSEVPGQRGGTVQYDDANKIFFAKGREFTYDMHGNAQHKVKKGPNAGKPGLPLLMRPVEKDKATGNILMTAWKPIAAADRTNASKGAYVVIP